MYPKLDTVVQLLKNYPVVPVFSQMLVDDRTPVGIFSALCGESENCFLLESAEQPGRWGRYSFFGFQPEAELILHNGKAIFSGKDGTSEQIVSNPAAYFADLMQQYRSPGFSGYPRFTGGFVGYFGYDLARYTEKILGSAPPDDLEMPDCILHLYRELLAFDHYSGRLYVIQNIGRDSDPIEQYAACEQHANDLFRRVVQAVPARRRFKEYRGEPRIRSDVSQQEYEQMVEISKQYIRAGDIFQVVPSRRFTVENPPDAFDVYRVLRSINPSPYLYYLQNKHCRIAGASPEMLVRVENGVVTNGPIAGTAPRGKTMEEDLALEKQLLNDEKERAEHTMLVDLGRNDVGRVSKYGSVKVHGFMHVERASKVMHLVSEVRGVLREDCTPYDALMAVLPAGTLSGAPKLRAMQIIDELEHQKRDVYGGAIGYLGFNGGVDTCIAIRTAVFRGEKAYVQAGAGIVADSVPENEFRESANKARAVLDAILEAGKL